MYKKTIKRGEKEYTYYYTNVREGKKVKNIFLRFDENKKEKNGFKSLMNTSDKNPALSRTGSMNESLYKYFSVDVDEAEVAEFGKCTGLIIQRPSRTRGFKFIFDDGYPTFSVKKRLINV